MMRMKWWEDAKKVYAVRGYLVFGYFYGPRQLGQIITRTRLADGDLVELPQPFQTIAQTTREDYESQNAALGIEPFSGHEAEYFYRAVTE